MNNNYLDMALKYEEQNIKVFPLTPGTKIPLKNTKGSKEATTDKTIIKEWWTKTPNANIGLVTSDFFVLDIDTHSDENNGFKSLETIVNTFGELPQTFSVTTGNDGLHLYFKKPIDIELSQRIGLAKGIDLKAHPNNYVVAPPSQIKRADGSIGFYQIKQDMEIVEPPKWLIDFINRDEGNISKTPITVDYSNSKRYKSKTTIFLETLVKGAKRGTRNDTIAYLTGKALSYGLKPSLTYKLVEFANSNFDEPLDKKEMDKTIESIFKKELAR